MSQSSWKTSRCNCDDYALSNHAIPRNPTRAMKSKPYVNWVKIVGERKRRVLEGSNGMRRGEKEGKGECGRERKGELVRKDRRGGEGGDVTGGYARSLTQSETGVAWQPLRVGNPTLA